MIHANNVNTHVRPLESYLLAQDYQLLIKKEYLRETVTNNWKCN
jgi:hypothetical protein